MPVLVTNYTWTQSPSVINITVPLNGVPSSYVDLFTYNNYIKAHYKPFLFEIFLLHDISIDKSKCYLQKEVIQFELIKTEEQEWETLEKKLTKQEKISAKKELHKKCQDEAQENFEQKKIRKSELSRFTVQQAMNIDSETQSIMDKRRDAEREKAMKELEDWRVHSMKSKISKPTCTITEINESPHDNATNKSITHKKITTKKLQKSFVKSVYVDKKREEHEKRIIPPVRNNKEIEIVFSERVFPTPSRESKAEEETIWLRKMTEARRVTGFVSEDLRPEEQDPQWCKDKGDEFFKDGNFLGAISAYTHAIKLCDKWPSLYSNRAATHFALGNFNKCMIDCSTALDLMKPECEANRMSRARCIARRAAALARSGMLNKAIDEMKVASKLLPNDEKIKKDIYDMERAWEQNPDSD